jgi:hypothetical protein
LTEAEALAREALAGRRETLGLYHPATILSVKVLSEILRARGDDEAIRDELAALAASTQPTSGPTTR